MRELEVAVLGGDDPIVSVVGEILPAGEFYDFKDKYLDGLSTIRIPAELPEGLDNLVHQYAVAAFRSLDACGMARVDFFLDRSTGRLFLNEINFIPGFTSISMYPRMMEASGVPYRQLLTLLIEQAVQRHQDKAKKTKLFQSGSTWYEQP